MREKLTARCPQTLTINNEQWRKWQDEKLIDGNWRHKSSYNYTMKKQHIHCTEIKWFKNRINLTQSTCTFEIAWHWKCGLVFDDRYGNVSVGDGRSYFSLPSNRICLVLEIIHHFWYFRWAMSSVVNILLDAYCPPQAASANSNFMDIFTHINTELIQIIRKH